MFFLLISGSSCDPVLLSAKKNFLKAENPNLLNKSIIKW